VKYRVALLRVLTLRGIELGPGRDEAKGVEVVSEHHQVWRCRPLDGSRRKETDQLLPVGSILND